MIELILAHSLALTDLVARSGTRLIDLVTRNPFYLAGSAVVLIWLLSLREVVAQSDREVRVLRKDKNWKFWRRFESGDRSLKPYAELLYPYARLSELAYLDHLPKEDDKTLNEKQKAISAGWDDVTEDVLRGGKGSGVDLKWRMFDTGLAFRLWRNRSRKTHYILVFRGTEGLSVDWLSNLRMFFRSGSKWDQYQLVSGDLRKHLKVFFDEQGQQPERLHVTGHSLGGGLALHFAAAYGEVDAGKMRCYVFNSSPVVALGRALKVQGDARDRAKRIIGVDAYENGEVLALIRYLIAAFMPFNLAPHRRFTSLKTVRFNFSKSARFISDHAVALIADRLGAINHATWSKPREEERLRQLELIYDYVKFHIAMYLATPPVVALLAQALGVQDWTDGLLAMILIYACAGIHAGFFMGRNVNRRWDAYGLHAFEAEAFRPGRRFWHHWLYWAGAAAGFLPIAKHLLSR